MKKGANKVLIIILIVIAILAIAGGVFAYLYFATDLFKTGQELFAKYLNENLEEIYNTVNLEKISNIEESLKQNRNEQNTTISYLAEGSTQSDLELTIDTQNDPIDKKYYGILGLALGDMESALKVEYMIEDEIYSLRFTNAIKQFFSVQNQNLKQIVTSFGLDEETIDMIPDTIDPESFSLDDLRLTDEEKNTEINKYAQLLYNNIAKEKYQKRNNTVITLNAQTITTNAYILTLNRDDIKNVALKILEELKQDEILSSKVQIIDDILYEYNIQFSLKDAILDGIQKSIDELNGENKPNQIKDENKEEQVQEQNMIITVYAQNGKTVRIKLEQGLENVTVDTTEIDGKKQINMAYNSIDENDAQLSYQTTFIKENDNKLIVKNNNVIDEEETENEISIELIEDGNNAKINIMMSSNIGQISFNRSITLVDELEYDMVLNSENNIILNQLSQEQVAALFNAAVNRVEEVYIKPLSEQITKFLALFMFSNSNDIEGNIQFPSIDASGTTDGLNPNNIDNIDE